MFLTSQNNLSRMGFCELSDYLLNLGYKLSIAHLVDQLIMKVSLNFLDRRGRFYAVAKVHP